MDLSCFRVVTSEDDEKWSWFPWALIIYLQRKKNAQPWENSNQYTMWHVKSAHFDFEWSKWTWTLSSTNAQTRSIFLLKIKRIYWLVVMNTFFFSLIPLSFSSLMDIYIMCHNKLCLRTTLIVDNIIQYK